LPALKIYKYELYSFSVLPIGETKIGYHTRLVDKKLHSLRSFQTFFVQTILHGCYTDKSRMTLCM